MNTFETIQQKILGLTFILAPLLMAVGAAAQGLGIGETPSGNFSTAEGIFTGYGYLLMIPVVFKLAQILGRRAPILGTILPHFRTRLGSLNGSSGRPSSANRPA
ncbi:MAG: hypothetical protein AAF633_06735 [Chloroflexota bacterium]